jgi:hypothetical protein
LGLSSNEIDKVLTFVKYVLVKTVDEKTKEKLKTKIKVDYEKRLDELDKLFKDEKIKSKEDSKDEKRLKEIDRLFEENKDSLEKEFNRLKSIVSDLDFGSTILESDYRNIFVQFNDLIAFSS